MWHADEGRLHAYLDGQLAATGAAPQEFEDHLASCAECASRLAEASRVRERAGAILYAGAPWDPVVPPFETVLARTAFATGAQQEPSAGEPLMSTSSLPLPPVGPRFNHLVASRGGRGRAWNPRTVLFSAIAHVALLGGAVYLGVVAPKPEEKKQEEVTFVELKEPEPAPPKAEEAPPPPEAPKPVEAPPPPKGFQALVPPTEPPPAIPDVDMSAQAVNAQDFSGIGQVGGTSTGVRGGTPTSVVPKDTMPVFAVEETGVKPEIRNMREVERLLQRNYPRSYADAGVAGQVQVRFMIDEQGHVPANSITVVVATNDAFGEAAKKAVEKFQFKPIKYRGNFVRVWATMPITFQAPQ